MREVNNKQLLELQKEKYTIVCSEDVPRQRTDVYTSGSYGTHTIAFDVA